MLMELNIWCDESVKDGRYFSNFYGGVLVKSSDLRTVNTQLEKICQKHHLKNELKWQRVTEEYLEKYKAVIDVLFDLAAADKLKLRIMFTQNAQVPTKLTKEQRENSYFLLYYQFVKHAFGLPFCNPSASAPVFVRINFDYLPDTIQKRQHFKEYVQELQTLQLFRSAKVKFRKDSLAEVDSKKHLVLQCLDIVLGAMAFRLNDMHKEIPIGKKRRGKRTRAKEQLFNHISRRIRVLYPNFNIGESTGQKGSESNRWSHPYRHWKFIPTEYETDEQLFKP